MASDAVVGGIYETVRSEVRRAVSEIRTDLENVSFVLPRRHCVHLLFRFGLSIYFLLIDG